MPKCIREYVRIIFLSVQVLCRISVRHLTVGHSEPFDTVVDIKFASFILCKKSHPLAKLFDINTAVIFTGVRTSEICGVCFIYTLNLFEL